MSDDDQNGENKSFLARWSQRKREAKQPERDAPSAETDLQSEPVADGAATEEFDLSSLPKFDDLTATTDITAFLRKGVPEHLRNAALRKSWALDPAIRNYVNPALDYAYDWNTPGGVPGSSEIGAGMDVARLVSQIMGASESVVEPAAASVGPEEAPASDPGQSPGPGTPQELRSDLPTHPLRVTDQDIAAAQPLANADERAGTGSHENNPAASQQEVRRHGSAKPLV